VRPRTLASVAEAVDGSVDGDPSLAVDRVVADSRAAEAGALFVALAGERVDGHAFIDDAANRGARAAVVRPETRAPIPTVVVDDPGTALLALAAAERSTFEGTVVAITGANGKTTTKDLAAAVVGARFRTHASPASFNTEIGVPLTLLGAPEGTEVIVAELGARHVGDVALLSPVADPHIVVVTNVGLAHMEIFGSWDAIVAAAAEPVEALGEDGVALLWADDPVVRSFAARTAARVRMFGRATDADVRAVDVVLGSDGRATCTIEAGDGRVGVTLPIPGEHMVGNALAAVAIGLELGIRLDTCATALHDARVTPWRMERPAIRSRTHVKRFESMKNAAGQTAITVYQMEHASDGGQVPFYEYAPKK